MKRKPSDDEMEKERMKAEASIKLVLQEEKLIERRGKTRWTRRAREARGTSGRKAQSC